MDAGDLLSVVAEGKVKGKAGNALRLGAGDDLEGLDDTGVGLVLKARVLSLGVLTDDGKVDALVAGRVTGDVLAENEGGVHVQILADGDVEGRVAEGRNGGVEDTLKTDLVASQGLDRLLEGGVISRGVARDIELLPVDRDVGGLENGLDSRGSLLSDTVTGDQGNSVATSKLGRGDLLSMFARVGSISDYCSNALVEWSFYFLLRGLFFSLSIIILHGWLLATARVGCRYADPSDLRE